MLTLKEQQPWRTGAQKVHRAGRWPDDHESLRRFKGVVDGPQSRANQEEVDDDKGMSGVRSPHDHDRGGTAAISNPPQGLKNRHFSLVTRAQAPEKWTHPVPPVLTIRFWG